MEGRYASRLPDIEDRFDLREHYSHGSFPTNLKLRFDLYKFSDDGFDMHNDIVDELSLAGHETVVDVGCGDGEVLYKLRTELGHYGPLVGIDLSYQSFITDDKLKRLGARSIDFQVGEATNLGFDNDSIDILLSLFMLYHIPDPDKALEEFHRVIRPGGQLWVATSGPGNKPKHRQFERAAAEALGVEPPPVFSSRFDSTIAERLLTRYFTVEEVIQQNANIIITPDHIENYLLSLASMADVCMPSVPQKLWMQTMEEIALPVIISEMEQHGTFSDPIERHYYVCEKQPDF